MSMDAMSASPISSQVPYEKVSSNTSGAPSLWEKVKQTAQNVLHKLAQAYEKYAFEFVAGGILLTQAVSAITFFAVTPIWVSLAISIAGLSATIILNKLLNSYINNQHVQNYKVAAEKLQEIYKKIPQDEYLETIDNCESGEDLKPKLEKIINEMSNYINAMNAVTDQKVPDLKRCLSNFKLNSSLEECKRLLNHCDNMPIDKLKKLIRENLEEANLRIEAQMDQIQLFINIAEDKSKA
jgi:hypothetical protein